MLRDDEIYAGFPPERREAVRREARERYGEAAVAESERRVKGMSRARWEAVGAEGEAVNRDLADLLRAGRDVGDPEVQAVVARHHAWIGHFWTPTAEAYRGLGRTYGEHPEFRAYYEGYAPGLADFLGRAMDRFSAGLPAA